MRDRKHLNKTTIYYYKFDEYKHQVAKKIAELIRQEKATEAVKLIEQEFNDFLTFMRALHDADKTKKAKR